jgi:hypothetical protein
MIHLKDVVAQEYRLPVEWHTTVVRSAGAGGDDHVSSGHQPLAAPIYVCDLNCRITWSARKSKSSTVIFCFTA